MSSWLQLEPRSHQVAIAGRVSDAQTGRAIAGAEVAIKKNVQEKEIIAQARTAVDGHFHFLDLLDLPDGTYTLIASLPRAGSRYGTAQMFLQVAQRRITMEKQDGALPLPPTRIHGRVTRSDNHQPVAGASVRLRGDTQIVLTDADGQYALTDLVQGKPTVEVSVAKYETKTADTSLTPGQDREVLVQLTPNG